MTGSVEVTVHPARARPGTTLALLLGLSIASWTLGTQLLEPLLFARADAVRAGIAALTVAAAFAVALARWLLPTRYRLDETGVEVAFAGEGFAWFAAKGVPYIAVTRGARSILGWDRLDFWRFFLPRCRSKMRKCPRHCRIDVGVAGGAWRLARRGR